MRWGSSDAGQDAEATNPQGFAAIVQLFEMRQQAIQMKALQAALPQIATAAAGAPKGGEEKPPEPESAPPNL